MNESYKLEEDEQVLLKRREESRQIKNAKRNAMRVAKKNNIPKICDNCGLEEECIINFRDENVINNNPANLYYLCNPCFQEKKTKGHIKKEEYAKCSKCSKIRIFAPSLFDGNPICSKCCHEQLRENGMEPHETLTPIKIRKNGFPETPISMWYDKRGIFSSNLFKENKTSEESQSIKKFLQEVHIRFGNHKPLSKNNNTISSNNKSLSTIMNIIFEYSLDDFTPDVIYALSKKIEKTDYVFPITFDHETQKVWIGEMTQKSKMSNDMFFDFIDTNPYPDKIIKIIKEAKKDGELLS